MHKNLRGVYSLRTVPAGGAVHPFETYLSVHRVAGLETGLYRYLPTEHKLCLRYLDPAVAERFHGVRGGGDPFVRRCAVYFIWTVVPYRREWGGGWASVSTAIQVGHVCQNLHIASEAIGCGTCPTSVSGERAPKYDELLGVDGRNEFTVYAAAVGKLKSGRGISWSGQIDRVEARGDATFMWVKSFSWWDGDVFVAEFPSANVAGCAEGDFAGITAEIVDVCSGYDGWPLVTGTAIESQEDPGAAFEY